MFGLVAWDGCHQLEFTNPLLTFQLLHQSERKLHIQDKCIFPLHGATCQAVKPYMVTHLHSSTWINNPLMSKQPTLVVLSILKPQRKATVHVNLDFTYQVNMSCLQLLSLSAKFKTVFDTNQNIFLCLTIILSDRTSHFCSLSRSKILLEIS